MSKWTDKLTIHRSHLIAGALALVVGLLFAAFAHVVFGEEFATRQQARMYAPFAGERYGEGQRSQIRTLLIDDQSLVEAGQVWPAKYAYSARLLQALAQYQPKAVFIDIAYQAVRDDASITRLVVQLCAMQEQGIPVKLAAVRDSSGGHRLRPELEAVAGRCFEKVAVQYQPDEVDHLAWNYLLQVEGQHGSAPLRSAAVALAASGGVELPHGHHPMSLTWGLRPASTGLGWSDGSAEARSYCRADHGWNELWPTGLRELWFHDTQRPVCVFHETLRASELSQTSAADDARLRQQLQGKYIVLGLATSGSNDQVYSPIHGRIPGLYLHAMALDNLLTFGAAAPQDVHLLGAGSGTAWLFLLCSLLSLIITMRWLQPLLHQQWGKLLAHLHSSGLHRFRPGPWRGFDPLAAIAFVLACLLKFSLSILLGCALLWLGQTVFHIGFLSMIGIVFLTVVAEWTEFNERLLERLYPAAVHHADQPLEKTS